MRDVGREENKHREELEHGDRGREKGKSVCIYGVKHAFCIM